MDIEIEIIKGIPTEQINKFEDKVVYNCAVYTRELTKGASAFPYLSGRLQRSEVAAPIVGSNKEYGLSNGVDYAKYVWRMKNAKWTNPNTQPQWYKSVFDTKAGTVVSGAVIRAKGEI